MPNADILEAAHNLIHAAAAKRDESKRLLAELDHHRRETEKHVTAKSAAMKAEASRVANPNIDSSESAQSANTVRLLKKEMDDIKKTHEQHASNLRQIAEQLEREAVDLENEAKRLQAIA